MDVIRPTMATIHFYHFLPIPTFKTAPGPEDLQGAEAFDDAGQGRGSHSGRRPAVPGRGGDGSELYPWGKLT